MTDVYGRSFKPGDKVERSGIYNVTHDKGHTKRHQVTCVFGKIFPPCRKCGHGVEFELAQGAQHIEHNEHFK